MSEISESHAYSVFIAGETMDLCVPSRQAIADGWADWFNDAGTTEWLRQGVYPNHVEDQEAYLAAIRERDRFVVLICGKEPGPPHGIISLSSIDWVGRSAQIALVLGKRPPSKKLVQLEAMARVTEHAFQIMGLDRVWAGQAFPALRSWGEWLELVGYWSEGIQRHGFTKGRKVSDLVIISCLYADYERIVARRGQYWPGNEAMLKLVRARPKSGLGARLATLISSERDAYVDEIEAIERDQLGERR